MKLLVVTPLQKELDYFLQSCIQCGYDSQNTTIGRLAAVQLPELGITMACGGLGKTQFGVQMQHLLDARTGWDLAACVGAAGALIDDVSVGDVVVGTTTVEHDYNNRFSARRLPSFGASPETVANLRRVATTVSFGVHFGTIASGDEDVVDVERRRTLYELTGALAVAWEGAGGARACRFSSVPYVEIRGVTDAANKDAPAAFEANLATAMHNVAAVITAWVSRHT